MKRTTRWAQVFLPFCLSLGVSGVQAQQGAARQEKPQEQGQRMIASDPELPRSAPDSGATQNVVVPRLVKFSGVLKDATGQVRGSGVVGMTFAIYKEQEGGAALWMETQNAQVDEQGRYAVLLGATKNEGLPVELFAAAEPRWLGVQVNLPGEVEQPRVLLVSVPYALKAADAENLGGRPASSYALATGDIAAGPDSGGAGGSAGSKPGGGKKTGKAAATPATGLSGTMNFIPVFTDNAGSLGNSVMVQNSTGVGVLQSPTSNPTVQFDVNGGIRGSGIATGGRNTAPDSINTNSIFLNGSDAMAVIGASNAAFAPGVLFTKLSFFAGNGSATAERLTVDGSTGNVGVGNTAPTAKLHVASPSFNAAQFDGPEAFLTLNNTLANVLQTGISFNSFGTPKWSIFTDTGGNNVNNLSIRDNAAGATRLFVDPAGNVGIGTAAPSQKLEVQGNAKVSGTGNGVIFPDGTMQTTAAPFPLTPTKSGTNSAIVGVGSSGTSWTPAAVLTITPTQSGIVNLFVRVRYNFKLAFASQVVIGTFVTSSATAPTSTTGFTDAVTAGWASGAGTGGGTFNGDMPVAFGQTLSVTAGTTLFIWVGVTPVNFDSVNQSATISSVGVIATLNQTAGL